MENNSKPNHFSISNITPFAKKVYCAVLRIPLGQVRSYKWIAAKAGRPGAARAVGQILKRNPYPLIIPCHRVVKADGKAGGYLWGSRFKERLLRLEKEISKILTEPSKKISRKTPSGVI